VVKEISALTVKHALTALNMSATVAMVVLNVQLSAKIVLKNVQIVQKKISVAVVIPALTV